MSDQADSKQAAPLAEDTARLTATFLLMDAIEDIPCIAPHRELGVSEAILIAAHAIISKLDSMESSHIEAMRDLRESLDFLGAHTEGDEPTLKPTAREREIIYRALEEEYISKHQAANIDEMDANLRRFKRLAGIEV